jgi:hypothetical protein
MPAIVQSVLNQTGAATPTTLTGSGDTFTYVPGTGQVMYLRNPTGSTITPKLIGDAASAAEYANGLQTFSLTAGYPASGGNITAGTTAAYSLDQIFKWLVGNCSVTSGSGLTAIIIT